MEIAGFSANGSSALPSSLHTLLLMSYLYKHAHQSKSSTECVSYDCFFPLFQLSGKRTSHFFPLFYVLPSHTRVRSKSKNNQERCQVGFQKYLPQLGDIPDRSHHSLGPGTNRILENHSWLFSRLRHQRLSRN